MNETTQGGASTTQAGATPDSKNPLTSPEIWDLVSDAYVTDTLPFFEQYASYALDLSMLPSRREVLDVAAGPGTLAVLAAERGHQVTALDFAPAMLAHLKTRAELAGVLDIAIDVGDGQQLPYADESFDAAFSMFGLMFFADRRAGFEQLCRVLRPGGRAVVSAWTPAENVPTIRALYHAIRGVMTGRAFGDGAAPLSTALKMRDEMLSAGFRDAVLQEVSFEIAYSDVDAFWSSMSRGSVPLVALKKKLGDAWPAFGNAARERFRELVDDGPVAVRWPAVIGMGTRPRR